jgi:hypothetical protein
LEQNTETPSETEISKKIKSIRTNLLNDFEKSIVSLKGIGAGTRMDLNNGALTGYDLKIKA